MKETYTHESLYPNEHVAKAVADYSFEHSTKLPKHITDHHAWGSNHERSNYVIWPLQAQMHLWLAKAVGAKRILEIGTFIGFSTMGWSEAVGPGGHVTALDFSPEYAKIAEESFERNGIKNVEVIVGDARESPKKLASCQPYDLIFIDADKSSYPTYLSLILTLSEPSSTIRLLRPGGIILADNILRRGLVADSSDNNLFSASYREKLKEGLWKEADMKGLEEFNERMVGEKRLETFLMPVFDGLGCGRLVD